MWLKFIPLSVQLDNKTINDVTRSFLKNFDRVKAEQKQKLTNITNANDAVNNTVDIDLRDDLPLVRSDVITFDVTNIISQAIVENVHCKPWAMQCEWNGTMCGLITDFDSKTWKTVDLIFSGLALKYQLNQIKLIVEQCSGTTVGSFLSKQ